MTLFMSMFHPPVDGAYRFRCTDKDDRATIWLDLDGDGQFELNGDKGEEKLGGNENFTSNWVNLSVADGPFQDSSGPWRMGWRFEASSMDNDSG